VPESCPYLSSTDVYCHSPLIDLACSRRASIISWFLADRKQANGVHRAIFVALL